MVIDARNVVGGCWSVEAEVGPGLLKEMARSMIFAECVQPPPRQGTICSYATCTLALSENGLLTIATHPNSSKARNVYSSYTLSHPGKQAQAQAISSSETGFPYAQNISQLRLLLLHPRHQHLPNIPRRLIQEKAHPITPQMLTHDIELDAANLLATSQTLISHLSSSITHLFSLIIYAIPHPASIT